MPHKNKGDRECDEPTANEDGFAADRIRESAGEVVRHRFDDAENNDERKHRRTRCEMKFLLGDGRQDGSFKADHGSYEGVDNDEQGKLRQIRAEAELN